LTSGFEEYIFAPLCNYTKLRISPLASPSAPSPESESEPKLELESINIARTQTKQTRTHLQKPERQFSFRINHLVFHSVMSDKINDNLKIMERECKASLELALESARTLAALREQAKLSASRPLAIARELKELIKVISAYGV